MRVKNRAKTSVKENPSWITEPLGEVLRTKPQYGLGAPARPLNDSLPRYLRITDISDDGRYMSDSAVSVDHPMADRYFLSEGDIVVARTGASVGKSYLYNKDDGELVYAGFLIRLQADHTKLDPRFLKVFLTTSGYWNWVKQTSMRSGQPGVNGNELATLPIPLPEVGEQRRIANALADVDALIKAHELLIAKKRNIKQAAMQQLLTGKTRLPGFSGEWRCLKLGSLGMLLKGSGVSKAQAHSGPIACIRYGELYTLHDNIIRSFGSRISEEVSRSAVRLHVGDVLFAGSGETKEEIGKCAAFVDQVAAYAGGDIIILRVSNECPEFLGFYLNSPQIQSQKASKGQGDAVVHISGKALSDIDCLLPEPGEQEAIARVLLDMEREIQSLTERMRKTRAIKQGMMQQLLTGKVRLV